MNSLGGDGNFVVHKTGNAFSGLAIDQAHEQHNAMVKGQAGARGLTQDPTSLRRFTVAGPEVGFILSKFEDSQPLSQLMKHHEQYPYFQRRFLENCVAVKESFTHFGNPFLEQGPELLALDTRVVTIQKSVETLVFEAKEKKRTEVGLNSFKTDVQLFSRLFIVARERDLNLDTFFEHENHKFPPAISNASGMLRTGKKCDLMEKLETLSTTEIVFNNSCDAIVYDGAAVVQMIRPAKSKTFEGYFSADLKPFVESTVRKASCSRIDVVWDLYLPGSLKAQERDSRGCGVRRNVVPNGALPQDWSDFVLNDKNKSELFRFLARRFIDDYSGAKVVTNTGDIVHSSDPELTSLEGKTINMEEADNRILLHVKDCVEHGAKVVVIRSSDTDVLVISISYFHHLQLTGLQELWFLTGVGPKRRYIPVHEIANNLGEEKSEALRGFHAYTGCDTTAYFAGAGKGKKTCFNTWSQNPEFTPAFLTLAKPVVAELDDTTNQLLEAFVCRLCDQTSETRKAAIVRRDLFIPPSSSSLQQKALRSVYQAGHVWQACQTRGSRSRHQVAQNRQNPPHPAGTALDCDHKPPSPSAWGWQSTDRGWKPVWTAESFIWEELAVLSRCGCKTRCSTLRCVCKKSGVPCTLQCTTCKGICENKRY
ncbi:ATP-binding cassette sub-family A member 9 [Frankliniella fusca]|uniref:ATP-binding cassette sub-family A member 9 n=1 Tax=Frankliniella fusca TaxID=407009 RepID=A0AAE1GVK8_9NEOP|nr:ATP-binding cassette sub-family A member 9 [Frankliniella fusca]